MGHERGGECWAQFGSIEEHRWGTCTGNEGERKGCMAEGEEEKGGGKKEGGKEGRLQTLGDRGKKESEGGLYD